MSHGQVGARGTSARTDTARKKLSKEVILMHRKSEERQPCRDLRTGPHTKESARAKAVNWGGVWQVQDLLARCSELAKNGKEKGLEAGKGHSQQSSVGPAWEEDCIYYKCDETTCWGDPVIHLTIC